MSPIKYTIVLLAILYQLVGTSIAWAKFADINIFECDEITGLGSYENSVRIVGFERFLMGTFNSPIDLRLEVDGSEVDTIKGSVGNFAVESWAVTASLVQTEHITTGKNLSYFDRNDRYWKDIHEPLNNSIKPLYFQLNGETGKCADGFPEFDIVVRTKSVPTLRFQFKPNATRVEAKIATPSTNLLTSIRKVYSEDYNSIFSIENSEFLLERPIKNELYEALYRVYFSPNALSNLDENLIFSIGNEGLLCTNPEGTYLHKKVKNKIVMTLSFTDDGRLNIVTIPKMLKKAPPSSRFLDFGDKAALERLARYSIYLKRFESFKSFKKYENNFSLSYPEIVKYANLGLSRIWDRNDCKTDS